jgi:4-amino-4-deoxy-L-arabinose transferase-like glycosyltransferase
VTSILLGVALRVVWGFVVHPPGDFVYSDMAGYVERARWLAAGGAPRRQDAFFPPGAHVLLAFPFGLFGPDRAGLWAGAAVWCLLSSIVPFFAWRLARLLLAPAAAAMTAAFCVFWPLHVTYGGFFTSETPSLAFLLAALWFGYRARRASGGEGVSIGLLAGLLGGVAAANRPQFVLNLAILALPALLHRRRQAPALVGIAFGTAVILSGVVAYNSVAAGKPTGLSENSALNFWMGHCNVREVRTADPRRNASFRFALPVPIQLRRGGSYSFEGRLVWDQPFFYDLGLQCIREDGIGHVRLLARNVLDATATTIPWPQVGGEEWQRGVVQLSNLAYCLLLPWIVIESLFLVRRRAAVPPSGETVMLAHLACAAVVAALYFGDPRIRSSYDVFGLALLAALLTDRLGLDGPEPADPPGGPRAAMLRDGKQ